MDYCYMFYTLNFYNLEKKEVIRSVIPEEFGEVIDKLSNREFIDEKISKGDYHSLKINSLDLPEIKDMKRCQNSNNSFMNYPNYLIVEPSSKPNFLCFARIVKLEKIHLLTHSRIFGYEDETGSHPGDIFLKTLFSNHIKIQNLLTKMLTEVFNYQLARIIDNISKPRLYDLTKNETLIEDFHLSPFNYQWDNLNWMIERESKGIILPLCQSRLYHMPDGRYYDYNNSKFISDEEYYLDSATTFNSGIILDDVGIGKTFQMLSLIKSTSHLKTAILIPNHLKEHWKQQMKKHFKTPFVNATIFTFSEFKSITDKFDRLVIDEIHEIFDKEIRIQEIPKIKYRWGLTATPFTKGAMSISGLLSYLTWNFTFNPEIVKYQHLIPVWNDLFRRNIRDNIKDELEIPPVIQENHFIKLNSEELSLYQTEAMSHQDSIQHLRKICCDVMMMINKEVGEKITREQFIMTIIKKYQESYDSELEHLKTLDKKLEEIEEELKKSNTSVMSFLIIVELNKNKQHYLKLKKEQEKKVQSTKDQLDHISVCMKEGEECPICYDTIPDSFAITKCRHFFCVPCLKHSLKSHHHCPMCKTPTTLDEVKVVTKEMVDGIKLSSKMTKVLQIINSSDEMFIIYTQFDYIIEKIRETLNQLDIPTDTLKKGSYEDFLKKKCRVLVASSESQMAGIDLSFINNLIIYEPFVLQHCYLEYYERQIIGRISRMGQTKECKVHRLICKDTVEEKIYSG